MKKPGCDAKKLILASASPRRKALLRLLGLRFTIRASSVPERSWRGGDPGDHVLQNALAKARDAAARIRSGIILGADTMVVLGKRPYGKPGDKKEARRFLRELSGKTHTVYTGVVLLEKPGGREAAAVETARVKMRRITAGEIDRYVATGEPLDKAGAYGIQERGAAFVESVEGDFYAVVGLPLSRLAALLSDFGVRVP